MAIRREKCLKNSRTPKRRETLREGGDFRIALSFLLCSEGTSVTKKARGAYLFNKGSALRGICPL